MKTHDAIKAAREAIQGARLSLAHLADESPREAKTVNAAVIAGAATCSADLHAVRWATRTKGRKPFDEPRWTKWHASADSCRTLCGLVIVIATEASFMPDTDDEISRVDCPRCARKLNPPNAELCRAEGRGDVK